MRRTTIEISLTDDELSTVALAAENRHKSVSRYIHDIALVAARRPMSRADYDEAIVELANLNWSAPEIALRLRLGRDLVQGRLRVLRVAGKVQLG
jgi:hypothetical protein